jgi:hypothetical protein
MKRLILCTAITASGFVFQETNAQSEPTKPEYAHKVYVADGNTYIQRSMPMYVKFSVTPDGQNYPLTSKQHPEDTEPMYLDDEGVHYIRHKWAVNPETGQMVQPPREVIMEIYADGVAPRTRHTFAGAPTYSSRGVTYFGKGLRFSLRATDAVSGVEKTQYALGGNYQNYNESVNVDGEGAKTLYYYSVDNVGNAETTRSSSFTVDLSAPNTSHTINGIVHNSNILAPSSYFTLSSSDNLAGVRTTFYSYNSQGDRVFYNRANMTGLQDGEHTLYYYAVDNVDNTADKKSFTFYLDRIAPVADIKVVGDQFRGQHLYISNRSRMNLTASDNKAGVRSIDYNIDGGGRSAFSSDFAMPDVFGLHTVRYDATDNVENRSGTKAFTVFMDNRAPQTRINYGSPQFFDRDTLYINNQTRITLPNSDAGSGVQKTEYAIDDAAYQSYSPFTISNEGYRKIRFRSTDNVNNVEAEKTSYVFVDNTPPEIFVNFSIQPIGERRGLPVYPNYVRMYIAATDKHTGTRDITYSINDGPMTAYSSPRTLDASERNVFSRNKKYSVKVVAFDKLGNRSEKTVEFYVGPEE